MSGAALYRDPTFDAVVSMETKEKGCRACQRRLVLDTGEVKCLAGKRFPFCQDEPGGFVMVVNDQR